MQRVSFAGVHDQSFRNEVLAFLDGATASCFEQAYPWQCQRWPGLHPPPGALVRHLHRAYGVADYSPYYYDRRCCGGDVDRRHGWERDTVVVYAGHGHPIGWQTYGYEQPPTGESTPIWNVPVCLSKVHIGDGAARYLFMLGCNVMAHGPLDCGASNNKDFGCPEKFEPTSTDLPQTLSACTPDGIDVELNRKHHDVFARWLPHLSPRLRLACGGSTVVRPEEALGFWHHHAVEKLPVAESLLLSLATFGAVPLCLSAGNDKPEDSPLYDQDFDSKPNLSTAGAYMFAMFPVRSAAAAKAAAGALRGLVSVDGRPGLDETPPADDWAPDILEMTRPTLPPWLAQVADGPRFERDAFGFKTVPPSRVPAGEPQDPSPAAEPLDVAVQPRSGALQIRWASRPRPESAPVPLLPTLVALFRRLELEPSLFLTGGGGAFGAEPDSDGMSMQIDRVAVTGEGREEAGSYQRCVYGRLASSVGVTEQRIGPGASAQSIPRALPVFGLGTEWLMRSCPSGTGTTPGADDTSLRLAGHDELSLFVAGRQVAGSHTADSLGVGPARTRPMARELAWASVAERLGMTVDEAKAALEAPTGELGYLSAPVHCRQTHMYPIYRFIFRYREGELLGPQALLTVDVSVYGPGMAFASEEWVCDPETP